MYHALKSSILCTHFISYLIRYNHLFTNIFDIGPELRYLKDSIIVV